MHAILHVNRLQKLPLDVGHSAFESELLKPVIFPFSVSNNLTLIVGRSGERSVRDRSLFPLQPIKRAHVFANSRWIDYINFFVAQKYMRTSENESLRIVYTDRERIGIFHL